MNEITFQIRESADGGFEAQAIGHAIYTQADNEGELRDMVRDAVQCHFEDNELPVSIRLRFEREEILAT